MEEYVGEWHEIRGEHKISISLLSNEPNFMKQATNVKGNSSVHPFPVKIRKTRLYRDIEMVVLTFNGMDFLMPRKLLIKYVLPFWS